MDKSVTLRLERYGVAMQDILQQRRRTLCRRVDREDKARQRGQYLYHSSEFYHYSTYFETAARVGANEKEARRPPTESTNSPGSIVGFRSAPMNDRSSGVTVKERVWLFPAAKWTLPNRTSRRPGGV